MLGLLSLAILGWWLLAPSDPANPAAGTASVVGNSPTVRSSASPGTQEAAGSTQPGSLASGMPGPDPLQQGRDLRDIYERYRDSASLRERIVAQRAWSACFPVFLSPAGQAISIESVTAALPAQDPTSASRVQAYRDIWARCSRFSDMPREALLQETQRQSDDQLKGLTTPPGQRALQAHQVGDPSMALQIARLAVDTQDPDDIDSLQDFLKVYWWDQNERQPDKPIARPDLRALAFSLAACQMGRDCSAASLTAQQQCAFTGACTGTVAERLVQSLPDAPDREALLAETTRTLAALRARDYRALGLQ